MPRPQTKTDLIEAADEKKKEAHWRRDKNLRDVLMHLHEWHNLLLKWIANNKAGVRKPFLMEGYNWKTYGDMNVVFWQRSQNVSYKEALEKFKLSHKEIMSVIQTLENDSRIER